MFDPLSVKVAIAFVATMLLFAAIYFIFGAPDPMRAGGRGSGWECDATRGGAVTCARDVKPPLSSHPKSSSAHAGDPLE